MTSKDPNTDTEPKGAERRAHPRVDAVIKVFFKNKEEYLEAYSKNISRGGIFLKVPQLPDPNAQVELSFTLPGENQTISVLGRVVRLMTSSDPDNPGKMIHDVGIAFINLSDEAKGQFERFYESASAD